MSKYDVTVNIQVVLEYDSVDTQNYPDVSFKPGIGPKEIIETMVREDFDNMGEVEMILMSSEPTNLEIVSVEPK